MPLLKDYGALSPYATRPLALFTVPLENFTGTLSAPYSSCYGGGFSIYASLWRYWGRLQITVVPNSVVLTLDVKAFYHFHAVASMLQICLHPSRLMAEKAIKR